MANTKKYKWSTYIKQGGWMQEFSGEVEADSWRQALEKACDEIDADGKITGTMKHLTVSKV